MTFIKRAIELEEKRDEESLREIQIINEKSDDLNTRLNVFAREYFS